MSENNMTYLFAMATGFFAKAWNICGLDRQRSAKTSPQKGLKFLRPFH